VMREKVCLHMCPYARFQSVMFDADTLIISYDAARGEPRRKPKQRAEAALTPNAGDCIDCNLCVEVCPTGIDIRDGLQYECISCAACIDACDTVMSRINKPKGLIRYTTENTLNGRYPERALRELLKRPKIILYGVVIAVISLTAIISFLNRQTFSVEIARDRGALSQINSMGQVENTYTLYLENETNTQNVYTVTLLGSDTLMLNPPKLSLTLAGGEKVSQEIQVIAHTKTNRESSTPIQFEVQNQDRETLLIKASFIDASDE
ncbi:MAG: 4Fe-4S dicluster domain-containing protein, partial [Neisseriaceae bacterium]|nr:4Fe-4S dicluster domain-containing protein [Neisseriaceae bacterium]